MEWISVKKSLPNKYEKVLVTDGESVCMHYKQSGANFEGSEGEDLYRLEEGLKDNKGKWISCCTIDEGSITHWMYLPKLNDIQIT